MTTTSSSREVVLHRVIFVLLVFEVLFSIFLAYDHYENGGFCSVGSCDEVKQSAYSEIFGISLNYIAVFCFIALFLAYRHNTGIYIIGLGIGGLAALCFIALQLFVIGAVCSNCMIIDGTMILIVILSAFSEKYRKHLKRVFGEH